MSSMFSSQDQFCPFWDQFCGFAYIIRLGDLFCLVITFAVVQALQTVWWIGILFTLGTLLNNFYTATEH